MTTVVNIRSLRSGWEKDSRYVYIGRARDARSLRGKWGNPHPIEIPCPVCHVKHTREEAITAFEREAKARYAVDASYRMELEELRGKQLVCFCFPRICHGNVYVKLLNESQDASSI